MKKSSIAERVFEVNLGYVRLQNKSKELFFRCLQEGRDISYFKARLEEIWADTNNSYIKAQILEYEAYLHELHTGKKLEEKKIHYTKGLAEILLVNKIFQKIKEKEYKTRLNSYGYSTNKEEYLKKLVPKYTSNTKRYQNGAYVKPSTYNSMVYNTCLTRNGWIQTLNDGLETEQGYYYIPYHSFSCPHCLDHQERAMTREECLKTLGTANEREGDILHPNCKCVLTFFSDKTQTRTIDRQQAEQQYQIREKVMSLELKKEEILSDMRIQKELGNQDEVDKLNQQRNKINSSIRELKNELPTEQLQKQVVAR